MTWQYYVTNQTDISNIYEFMNLIRNLKPIKNDCNSYNSDMVKIKTNI